MIAKHVPCCARASAEWHNLILQTVVRELCAATSAAVRSKGLVDRYSLNVVSVRMASDSVTTGLACAKISCGRLLAWVCNIWSTIETIDGQFLLTAPASIPSLPSTISFLPSTLPPTPVLPARASIASGSSLFSGQLEVDHQESEVRICAGKSRSRLTGASKVCWYFFH